MRFGVQEPLLEDAWLRFGDNAAGGWSAQQALQLQAARAQYLGGVQVAATFGGDGADQPAFVWTAVQHTQLAWTATVQQTGTQVSPYARFGVALCRGVVKCHFCQAEARPRYFCRIWCRRWFALFP